MLCPRCLESIKNNLRFCTGCGTLQTISLTASWQQLYNQGCTAYQSGNIETAQQLFAQSIRLNTNHQLSWYNLGTLQLKVKQLSNAVKFLTIAKHLDYYHLGSRINLASAQYLQANHSAAKLEVVAVLELDPHCRAAKKLLAKLNY